MAFTTENRKIENIFQRAAIYSVPRYQRDYVWKEVNWKELWIDLQFTLKNSNEIPWSHFLGTIVLNQSKDKENGLDKYEIIDGQQRMMTIYLLLIAIYKNFKRLSSGDIKNISNYIYESFLTSLTKESKRELMINNELYNEDLKFIIDAASNCTNIAKNNKLYKPFIYFDNNLLNKDYDYLDKFLNKLLSVNIVEIISGEDEEIYNIFEVLNARGQKLKQIELLKNHIMKYIQPRELEFIDKAKIKWRNIQKNIEHLNDPDVLIQHFAKCYIEKNADNQNSIYRLIKEEIKIDDLSRFLDKLEEFSEAYKEITWKDSNYETIKYFNIKRNQQIRSLLCAIFVLNGNDIIDEELKEKSLLQLRNFFFIFNTTQQTSNKTDKIISAISYKVYNCKTTNEFKIVFSDFMYELESYIVQKDYKLLFESNQSFKYSNKDTTMKRNNKLVKFVLEQICVKDQHDTKIDSNNLTIEHLKSDDGSLDNSSIWNLTLTTDQINSEELKNKEIKEKIKILKEKSTIRINQNLDEYLINGVFDFNKRKSDFLDLIFDEIFTFEPDTFNISKEEISLYNKYEKSLMKNNDSELVSILKENGTMFLKKLENDPKLKNLYDRFNNYRSTN
jgi:uncharacterized protein with ParB-like and HNH nuclease domain|nr:DUF262 domain-containing protein [uncultured Peptostreptococcus sp.]